MAELLINVMPEQTRVALTENFKLCELYVERAKERSIVGNIYKGKVVRVMKGMQAVFVEIGEKRTAFLYVDEVKDLGIPEIEDNSECVVKTESYKTQQIDKLLKQGEELIVQVIKEPRGEKGGRLTCYLTLPSRHLVLLPNINRIGVSRKIEDQDEKRRLLGLLQEIKPKNMGLIARTAAKGKEKRILESELKSLLDKWAEIETKAKRSKAPCKLYEEIPLLLRTVRDLLYPDINRIIVDNEKAYQEIHEALESMAPEFLKSLELYRSNQPLFDAYNIEREIDDALNSRVWLRSGGFLIIQPTEAMTVIDVNSGKYEGYDSSEKTALAIDLEAVKVIAKELRRRNLSGIVVIDFIGVESRENKQKICEALAEEMRNDRARVSMPKIFSELGLVEFTRQRRYPSIVEMLCSKCPVCDGKGYVKSPETIACEILSRLDELLESTLKNNIKITVHPTVANIFKNKMAESILSREAKSKKKITIEANSAIKPDKFKLSTE